LATTGAAASRSSVLAAGVLQHDKGAGGFHQRLDGGIGFGGERFIK
jgi:hypothetical protein